MYYRDRVLTQLDHLVSELPALQHRLSPVRWEALRTDLAALLERAELASSPEDWQRLTADLRALARRHGIEHLLETPLTLGAGEVYRGPVVGPAGDPYSTGHPPPRDGLRSGDPTTRDGLRSGDPTTRDGLRSGDPTTRDGLRSGDPTTRDGLRSGDPSPYTFGLPDLDPTPRQPPDTGPATPLPSRDVLSIVARVRTALGLGPAPVLPPLETFPEVQAPSSVPLRTRFTVRVTARARRTQHTGDRLTLPRRTAGPVDLEVALKLPPDGGLEALGALEHPLRVTEAGDSATLQFELFAATDGLHLVAVVFRRQGLELEVRRLEVFVDATPAPAIAAPAALAGPALPQLETPHRGLTLALWLSGLSAEHRHLDVTLQGSPGLLDRVLHGQRNVPLEHAALLTRLCQELLTVEEAGTWTSRERRLQGVGETLAVQVLPADILEELAAARYPAGTSLHIQSDDAWLPWEALWIGPRQGGFFLGERFAVTRWLRVGQLRDRLEAAFATLVAPTDSGLQTRDEQQVLEALLGRAPRELRGLDEVQVALEAGAPGGIWHFACHGYVDGGALGSWLELEGGDRLRPTDVPRRNAHNAAPLLGALVFVNACQSGTAAYHLTGHGSWADCFLKAGAGAVLAPAWSVGDHAASMAASRFYQAVLEADAGDGGRPISLGEAARRARLAAHAVGDATRLAYALYAAPTARLWVRGGGQQP